VARGEFPATFETANGQHAGFTPPALAGLSDSVFHPNHHDSHYPHRLSIIRVSKRVWVFGVGLIARLDVEVKSPSVTHAATMRRVQEWLDRACKSPNEKAHAAEELGVTARSSPKHFECWLNPNLDI
jgi:hypothetical protein